MQSGLFANYTWLLKLLALLLGLAISVGAVLLARRVLKRTIRRMPED